MFHHSISFRSDIITNIIIIIIISFIFASRIKNTSYDGRWRHSSWSVDDGVILMGGDDYGNTTVLVKIDGTSEETFGLKYSATM